jgi:hypothetical protein
MGVLLPIALPVLLVGIVASVRHARAADLVVIGWLLVTPLAAALTDDGVPHFARGIFALPIIILAMARGSVELWDWVVRRGPAAKPALALAASVVVVAQLLSAYTFYFTDYPRISAGSWRVGAGAAMSLARDGTDPGGLLCIDPGALSYWTFPQFVAWYLPDASFTVVEGLDDTRCGVPGSLELGHPDAKVSATAVEIGEVVDANGNREFVLWRVA